MSNISISVLIPAYNVESYLSRCIDSVLSQSFNDFEVILIDDGSSDSTGKICDEYANKDSRIKVFHQKNQGISATRNLCLKYASGEYIQFVDSDDWIEPDMLESMYKKAVEQNAVVGCNFIRESSLGPIFVDSYYNEKKKFLLGILKNGWGVLWKLLIKRSILIVHNIDFPNELDGGEDFVFVVKVVNYASIIVCVKNYFYHYNELNNKSFIKNPSYKKAMDQYHATEIVSEFLSNNKDSDNHSLDSRKIYTKSLLLNVAFFKTFRLYPEIDKYAIFLKMSKKTKMLFILSLLFNKVLI